MTRIFGIVGYPIDHSLSPVMHGAAFRALGVEAIYAPFAVPPRDLRRALTALTRCGVAGLNVTVPHKEAVLRLLRRSGRVDAEAARVGAVNTLVRRSGRFVGYNTDVEGVRRTLREELRVNVSGKTVLILGAGGAARAVGWALLGLRPKAIWVMNRTYEKAIRLARWLDRRSRLWVAHGAAGYGVPTASRRYRRSELAAALAHADLFVNATSLGLREGDPLPLAPGAIHKRLVVMDLVYRAPTTALVAAARRRGALAVDGVPMLVYQGAESFRLWWRREPPLDVMRRAVMRALGNR